jgi:enamine deaminase RidA (YjgF/YER057c/UK114 family)
MQLDTSSGRAPDTHEGRLRALGLELPQVAAPAGNYVPMTRTGRTVFVSGQGPITGGRAVYTGKVGTDVSQEDGYLAARLAALNLLAVLRQGLGSLDKVGRLLKLQVWVRSAVGFDRQHMVANGASDIFTQVLGNAGKCARSAVSASELPFGITVEIDVVAEASDDSSFGSVYAWGGANERE